MTIESAFALHNAAQAITLNDIMRRHTEAMGGYEKIMSVRTSKTVSKVTVAGMTGTSVIYYKYPDKFRSDVELPMATVVRAADGSDFWMQDLNGQKRRAAGEEAKELVTTLFMASGDYMKKEFWDKSVRYKGDEEVDGKTYYKILLAPVGGLEMTLYLDPDTYLIALTEETMQSITVQSWLEDYRNVDGLMVPFRNRQVTGIAMLDADAVTTLQEFNIPLDDSLFTFSKVNREDSYISDGMTRVDLDIRSFHVYLPVMIGSKGPFSFLLDSGAGMTIVGRDVAADLDLKKTGELPALGVGGVEVGSFVEIDSLIVGNAVMRDLVAGELDLSSINEIAREPVDGILGYDLFARFAVQLDYYDSIMTLYLPNDSLKYSGEDTLALEVESNHPMINATINDTIRGRFRVDTGSANYLDIGYNMTKQHDLVEKSHSIRRGMQLRGIGGATVESINGRIDSLKVGKTTLHDVPCGFAVADSGILAIKGVDGNIGGGLLDKFTCIFDYSHGRFMLSPNPHAHEKDRVISTGISLRKSGDEILVDIVLDGTSAQTNGVEVGDTIVTVNGVPVDSMELYQVTDLLNSEDNRVVELQVKHGGKVRSVKLERRPLY
jgi:hypothetical protein